MYSAGGLYPLPRNNIRLHFIPVHLLQEVDSVLPVTGLGKGADCLSDGLYG